jgi:hypothetical protein
LWKQLWDVQGKCSKLSIAEFFSILINTFHVYNANNPVTLSGISLEVRPFVDRDILLNSLERIWGKRAWLACNPETRDLLYVSTCFLPVAPAVSLRVCNVSAFASMLGACGRPSTCVELVDLCVCARDWGGHTLPLPAAAAAHTSPACFAGHSQLHDCRLSMGPCQRQPGGARVRWPAEHGSWDAGEPAHLPPTCAPCLSVHAEGGKESACLKAGAAAAEQPRPRLLVGPLPACDRGQRERRCGPMACLSTQLAVVATCLLPPSLPPSPQPSPRCAKYFPVTVPGGFPRSAPPPPQPPPPSPAPAPAAAPAAAAPRPAPPASPAAAL